MRTKQEDSEDTIIGRLEKIDESIAILTDLKLEFLLELKQIEAKEAI